MAMRPTRRPLARLACAVAVLALATCTPPPPLDFTARHPIEAVPETVNWPANFSGGADPFAGANAEGFDTLVQGYLDHGHGPITIVGAQRAVRTATPRMMELRKRLMDAGVPGSEIRLELAAEGDPDTVTLSYERYTAVLPQCGDFSHRMEFNYDNSDYPNMGCDQQHNIGAMLADPADIESMRRPENTDAVNMTRVIVDYRTGQAPETTKNQIQQSQDNNSASGMTSFTSQSLPGGTSTR